MAIYERHGYVRYHHEPDVRDGAAPNRAIASALFISERTVETHIAAIFDRFDLSLRTEFASLLETLP